MKLVMILLMMLTASLHAASLEFAETSKEIAVAMDAETATAEFAFTNKSDKTITIKRSDAGCTCVSAVVSGGKFSYAPGESGTIRATFEIGNYSETVEKILAVWLDSDSPEVPSVKLFMKFKIPVLVKLEPRTLKWTVGDKAEPKTIKISMAEGQAIHITNVESSSEAFTQEVKKIKDGSEYELVVTPKSTEDAHLAIFRIDTDCSLPKHRIQQVFGVVRRPTAPAGSDLSIY
ncbi:MAG: DUF1573 domain-containing protein [Akkermansiaceae bacterium]|nr:DUF1573 domain-containing protein [Akkermansiaceae bacterium]